jgi:hypothetical protein
MRSRSLWLAIGPHPPLCLRVENGSTGAVRVWRIYPATAERLFRFKDDVTVTIRRDGDTVTIGMRSHAHIGKGDLGANARRIRLFQEKLAARVAAGATS